MSDRLSIPLVLRAPDATRLTFSFPAWYRALMGAILLVLLAGLVQEGARPGWPMGVLVAIVALYFIHGRATGDYTFDFVRLLGTRMSSTTASYTFRRLSLGPPGTTWVTTAPFASLVPRLSAISGVNSPMTMPR